MILGMIKKKQAVVRGSGNVFRDLALPNAELLQFKALLGAEIVRAMDELGLGARDAERVTKIAAADFSRIRSANLGRFTADRLMTILNRLGREVDVSVRVRPKETGRFIGA
jgi:predicted XRE-type DNA-binding protein